MSYFGSEQFFKIQNLHHFEMISLYQELGTPFESCLRTFQKGFQQQSCSSGRNSFIQRHQQQFFPLFFSVCFCCCLLFYHAEFMTLFLILLGLKQNPGCRSNSGVKYSCDNPSTSTRHIVKCNQQADFSLFSAFFLKLLQKENDRKQMAFVWVSSRFLAEVIKSSSNKNVG